MRNLVTLTALAVGLVAATSSGEAEASKFCKHGGKRYAINATRCDSGNKLRCVDEDTWKAIGTCKAKEAPKGPQRCKHGGKSYSIGSTRCDGGDKLRCVKADTWKRIGSCKK